MQTPEQEKKGPGRKRTYTSDQLAAAIDAVGNEGREPTPALVSKALSELFGISGTIRGETLAREITAHVQAENQLREDALLAALPNDVTSRIAAQFTNAERVAGLIVAGEFQRLSKAQHERDVSASRERAMLVAQNKQLEAELEEARAQVSELEEALRKSDAEKTTCVDQLRSLELEIEKLEAAGNARNEAFAEIERFFAEKGWTPPEVPRS